MTLFALINRDLTDTGQRLNQASVDGPDDVPITKPYYVEVVEVTTDNSTPDSETVTSPFVDTVEATRLLRERTIRDKTPAELDAEDTARVEKAFTLTGINRSEMRMIFELIKAVKTGNVTFFDTVVDVPTFKTLARSLFR